MRGLLLLLSLFSARAFQGVSKRWTISTAPPMTAQHQPGQKPLLAQKILAATVVPGFLALTVAVTPANAFGSSVFNHEYADPLHPLCDRKIEVAKDGKTFHYSGQAVGPKDGVLRGCSRQEIEEYGGLRQESFDGEILDNNRISSGDGTLEGFWEPQNVADTNLGYEDVDGIRWKDGNKWVVNSQSQATKNKEGKYVIGKKPLQVKVGEVIFLAYIGFRYVGRSSKIVPKFCRLILPVLADIQHLGRVQGCPQRNREEKATTSIECCTLDDTLRTDKQETNMYRTARHTE
eukprot:scaffold2536_cov169-Amphora_coffeaeformis.AAC.34